ncbi:MAG: type II toxin-antitoxin system RelE family toxin [Sporichthyaceae bacterium]
MARVTFLDEAIADLNALDGSVLKAVFAKLAQLETEPERGEPLGSAPSGNLTGFRKLVVGDRTHRIVYRVEPNGDVCVVWVIAGRTDGECYDIAVRRLATLGEHPVANALIDAIGMLAPRVARRVPEPPE